MILLPIRIGWFTIFVHRAFWTDTFHWILECGQFPEAVEVGSGRACCAELATEEAMLLLRSVNEGGCW